MQSRIASALETLSAEHREHSLDRMIREAEALGANAVVALRFGTSNIASRAAEIIVYGTAVHIEDE